MLLRILTDSSLFCAISAMNCLVAEWLLQKHQTGQLLGPYDGPQTTGKPAKNTRVW